MEIEVVAIIAGITLDLAMEWVLTAIIYDDLHQKPILILYFSLLVPDKAKKSYHNLHKAPQTVSINLSM